MSPHFDRNNELIIERQHLENMHIDIAGRDIVIGFNEPAFKISSKNNGTSLDSKLNARLITYFLPAIQIARMQEKRPRLLLISGLNVSLKWNATSDKEKKIMTVNNNLKFNFLNTFFETFFPETFSLIENIVAQDPLKIDEEKLMHIWAMIEKMHPEEIHHIKHQLLRYKKPNLLTPVSAHTCALTHDEELSDSYKYALSHVLALGDINFEGNAIHNPIGYLSIGGFQEKTFNLIRTYAYELLKQQGERFFGKKIIPKNNLKLIIKNNVKTPPPYNGYYRNSSRGKLFLEEVTYENNRPLGFYNSHPKLRFDMEYMYQNLIAEKDYAAFWDACRKQYFEQKKRYLEAYNLTDF